MKLFLMSLGASLLLFATFTQAGHYPVTVTSCQRDVRFERAPQRAVSQDVNLTGMLLALGLRPNMAGYSGISGWKTLDEEFRAQLAGLPELAPRYPSVENLLNAGADLFFAGWNYGMHVGGEVTPATLAPLGIPVYELTESCAHVMPRDAARLEDLYADLLNLGRIFDVEPRAEALVSDLRGRVERVRQRVPKDARAPEVFLYDSGEDRPFTAGRLAMPQALIEAAGGRNLMDDLASSWSRVNWETVVERDPEVILIVDYGVVSVEQKREFLLSHPALQQVRAIREKRFVVLPYLQVTPSVDNVTALETLASALHPGPRP